MNEPLGSVTLKADGLGAITSLPRTWSLSMVCEVALGLIVCQAATKSCQLAMIQPEYLHLMPMIYSLFCFETSGGSAGRPRPPRNFLGSFVGPSTFLERYKILNFEYIVYCKYLRTRKMYKEWT